MPFQRNWNNFEIMNSKKRKSDYSENSILIKSKEKIEKNTCNNKKEMKIKEKQEKALIENNKIIIKKVFNKELNNFFYYLNENQRNPFIIEINLPINENKNLNKKRINNNLNDEKKNNNNLFEINEENINIFENKNLNEKKNNLENKKKPIIIEINWSEFKKEKVNLVFLREVEQKEIRDSVKNPEAKQLIIVGASGIGKTVVANSVLDEFEKNEKYEVFRKNAMQINSNPLEILKEIFNESTKTSNFKSEFVKKMKNSDKKRILIIDEIDSFLISKKNEEKLAELFKLCNNSKIFLIGICNKLDKISNFAKKNEIKPKILTFEPYTYKELAKIVEKQLENSKNIEINTIFEEKAIEMCAAKIYKEKNSDIRCMFELCNTLILEKNTEKISLNDIWKAFNLKYNTNNLKNIFQEQLSKNHLIFLTALLDFFKKEKSLNCIGFNDLFVLNNKNCRARNFSVVSLNDFNEILKTFENYGVIQLQKNKKIVKINVPIQDIQELIPNSFV